MSLLEHFRRSFAYDEWANREVLASQRKGGTPRSLELMSHIVSAERLWLARILRETQPFPVWPQFTLEQCEAEAARASELWREYLKQLSEAELAQAVTYTNTIGESYSSRLEDILTHVIMHSAYHRGQIASDTRASGAVPAYTDFIHAIRHGLVE